VRVTVLGSGTSTGVPMIACPCEVCTSDDPRNRRTRASIWVETQGKHFVVDTGPDFRAQALRERMPRLDAVLWTHAHADHTHGIDDIRQFNFRQKETIPAWASEETVRHLTRTFGYIWGGARQQGGGVPSIDLRPLPDDPDAPFEPLGVPVTPLPVKHGAVDVWGFRFGPFAYLTDLNQVPDATFERLRGVEVLVISALRHRPHDTHFHFEGSLEVVERVKPREAWFTHLNHEVDYARDGAALPEPVRLAYDGLTIELPD